jgi:hypothetical protein
MSFKSVVGKTVSLVCPCGRPLELFKIKDGELWALAHIDHACSPILHGTAEEVLGAIFSKGRLLTAEEYIDSFKK